MLKCRVLALIVLQSQPRSLLTGDPSDTLKEVLNGGIRSRRVVLKVYADGDAAAGARCTAKHPCEDSPNRRPCSSPGPAPFSACTAGDVDFGDEEPVREGKGDAQQVCKWYEGVLLRQQGGSTGKSGVSSPMLN